MMSLLLNNHAMKINKKYLLWLTFLVVLFFYGCSSVKVLIIYPGFNDISKDRLAISRINKAYESSVLELLKENSDRELFNRIRMKNINFIQSDKIFYEYRKEGIAALKRYLSTADMDAAIYAEITQPNKRENFCYSIIHMYIERNGLRMHQTRNIMMDYKTFEDIAYWKSEFLNILTKLDGVK